jgi:hypothetical protein
LKASNKKRERKQTPPFSKTYDTKGRIPNMSNWIKMRECLKDSPQVVELSQRLKKDCASICGYLFFLWLYADKHTVDGLIRYANHTAIDKQVGCKGFSKELERVKWIEFNESGAQIVGFSEHNGGSAKRRAVDSQRKQATEGKKQNRSLADEVPLS